MSEHLTDIFNLPITTGVFVNSLKSAKVISIHKKNLKLVMSNYRPISPYSNVDKVIEKLMYNRIIQFLEDKKVISYKQIVFRKRSSLLLEMYKVLLQQQICMWSLY